MKPKTCPHCGRHYDRIPRTAKGEMCLPCWRTRHPDEAAKACSKCDGTGIVAEFGSSGFGFWDACAAPIRSTCRACDGRGRP